MTRKNKTKDLENTIQQCYSTWGDRYYDEYYASENAYPSVHIDIVKKLLIDNEAKSLLDVGCGPASMLRSFFELDIELYGFDLTKEMVLEAQNIFKKNNYPKDNIWTGSVLEKSAYSKIKNKLYDSAICFGVLPHIDEKDDRLVLSNLKKTVKKGGLIAVEARNQLFSLFTLNKYTSEFFKDNLINIEKIKLNSKEDAGKIENSLEEVNKLLRMDLPVSRKGYEDEPGYDEVLSRTHNPFELKKIAVEEGFNNVDILFYHYHILPPMLQNLFPDLFRAYSLSLEDPYDWRGHFMASAFILVAYN